MSSQEVKYRIYFKKNPDFDKESCLELKGKNVDVDQYIPNILVERVEVHDEYFDIIGHYGDNKSSVLLWI